VRHGVSAPLEAIALYYEWHPGLCIIDIELMNLKQRR
jgi:hypothetical protein